MILLDTPPGQQPTSRMPKAKAGSSLKICTNRYATHGMMKNCAQAPIRISNGRWARMRKSSVVSVSPIVSMMMPRITVCVVPRTHTKRWGTKNVTTAMTMINSEAFAASQRLSRMKSFIFFNKKSRQRYEKK